MNSMEFVLLSVTLIGLGLTGVIMLANHYSPQLQEWGRKHIHK